MVDDELATAGDAAEALRAALIADLDAGFAEVMRCFAPRLREAAQPGKAALYRRWTSKRELVLDALLRRLPDPQEAVPSLSVRDDLLVALTVMTDALSGQAAYPGLADLAEMLRDPELRTAFSSRVVEPRLRLIQDILREGVARGEIRPPHEITLIARTGPALVIQTFLLTASPPPRTELIQIVDLILMPLLGPE